MAVINSSFNLIISHVLFAEIQRSLALESEKVERIRNITSILQSPTLQGPQRNFFFFFYCWLTTLAIKISITANYQVTRNFHNLNKKILLKGFVAIFKLIENECCKASMTKLKNLRQTFLYASSNYSREKTVFVNMCNIFSIFRRNTHISLEHLYTVQQPQAIVCFVVFVRMQITPCHLKCIASLANLICDPTQMNNFLTFDFVESPKSRKPVSTILEIGVDNDEQISPDELTIWLARRKEIDLSRSP